MSTVHGAIAEALARALVSEAVPVIRREQVLPERIEDDGLINLTLEDPEEVGRRLGCGAREYERVAQISIVVAHHDDQRRRDILEERMVEVGAALTGDAALAMIGVDYIDVDAPDYEPDLDMEGSEPLSGAVVTATLFYETTDNTLERSHA